MIPVNIQDLIQKLGNKNTHINSRQFYYDTLVKISLATKQAIQEYERERNGK